MKVRITKPCFLKGRRYRGGEIINWDGKLSSWMEPVDAADKADSDGQADGKGGPVKKAASPASGPADGKGKPA